MTKQSGRLRFASHQHPRRGGQPGPVNTRMGLTTKLFVVLLAHPVICSPLSSARRVSAQSLSPAFLTRQALQTGSMAALRLRTGAHRQRSMHVIRSTTHTDVTDVTQRWCAVSEMQRQFGRRIEMLGQAWAPTEVPPVILQLQRRQHSSLTGQCVGSSHGCAVV